MTNDGWVTGIHEGYRTKTIKVGIHTVEINRPLLTAEERAKREAAVINVLKTFGRN